MKKYLVLAALSLASVAMAQTTNWTIRDASSPATEATSYRHEVIGFSTRDSVTKRARTAISLVCTNTPPDAKLLIQWENMQGYGNRSINYTIDKKPITPNGNGFVMRQEQEILYRDLETSRELLQAMKSGSTLTVDWVGFDQTRYLTTFNLSTFRSNLSEFNKRCKTDF